MNMLNKKKQALGTDQRWTATGGKQTYFRITEWRVVLGESVKVTSTFRVLLLIHFSAQVIQFIPGLNCPHSYCTSWMFGTTLFACHSVSWEMCSMITLLSWERRVNMCLSVPSCLWGEHRPGWGGVFSHTSAFTWRAHLGQARLTFKRQVWRHFSLALSYSASTIKWYHYPHHCLADVCLLRRPKLSLRWVTPRSRLGT